VPGRYARIRALAAFGFAGQYLFSLSWLVGGLVQDGYSFRRQAISELGARTADHPWIARLGISVWGLSVLPWRRRSGLRRSTCPGGAR
jgi:hypothetical membrane protein